MNQYDLMLDLKIKVGQIVTYISWFSGFALYLEDYLIYEPDAWGNGLV